MLHGVLTHCEAQASQEVMGCLSPGRAGCLLPQTRSPQRVPQSYSPLIGLLKESVKESPPCVLTSLGMSWVPG